MARQLFFNVAAHKSINANHAQSTPCILTFKKNREIEFSKTSE
ncbi:MAG: hypothetical protein ACJAWV_003727 [Flammeovirgaceae bacterium]|jgi:hypothetical protein